MRNSNAPACWTQTDSHRQKSTAMLRICCAESELVMPNRRSFGRLRRGRSKRWQAAYVGPDNALHYAPTTFVAKIDAEHWLAEEQRLISARAWTPPEQRELANALTSSPTLADYAKPWLNRPYAEAAHPRPLSALTRQAHPSDARRDAPEGAHTRRHPCLARGPRIEDSNADSARVRAAENDSRLRDARRHHSGESVPYPRRRQ
jgi:hypothetical protein